MDGGAWWAAVHGVEKSRTRLSDFTVTFHFHALEKEMATHSSVPAWSIPGTAEPGGLAPTGSHRVGHAWSALAAAAAAERRGNLEPCWLFPKSPHGQLLTVAVTCVKLPSAAKPGCSHFPALSCWVSVAPLWERSGSHFIPGESEALPWVPGAVGAGGLGAHLSHLPWCSWMFQKGVTSSIPAACPHRSSATFCCQRQRQPSPCFSPFSLHLQVSFIQAHPLPRHLQGGPGWGQPSHTREVISSCLLAMKGAPPKRWHVWTHTTCKAPFYMRMNHNKHWGNWGRERLGNFPEVTRQKNRVITLAFYLRCHYNGHFPREIAQQWP